MSDSYINTDPEEVNRIEAAFEATAIPIREVILGRCVGQPELVVFWLDAKDRPDVVDLVRVHALEGSGFNGEFRIVPTLFTARSPLRILVGLEITITDPVDCAINLLFDYDNNEEWIEYMIYDGRFGIETGAPDDHARAPLEGLFLSMLIPRDVCLQLTSIFRDTGLAIELLLLADPDTVKTRYRAEPLFRGQIWFARIIKPPRVPRGRQNREGHE